eukprot:2831492-Pyramimonas_sp.AAC.1
MSLAVTTGTSEHATFLLLLEPRICSPAASKSLDYGHAPWRRCGTDRCLHILPPNALDRSELELWKE